MESLGVDVFYAMPFDRSVMDMPPEDYVGHLVRQFPSHGCGMRL